MVIVMKSVIVIVGPTGVGKTKLSIELAKKLNGEIINADSTQIYKGLDIATAKIKEHEKEGIPHHLFDIKEITENYTVFDYQKDSRKVIDTLLEQGKTPILVGGTGLYIKASLYDYQFEPGKNENQYDDLTDEELYQKLLTVDPNTEIHKNNRKRVVRAYNYYLETGKPFSQKEKTDVLKYQTIVIGLTTNRDVLYERINKRVDEMVEEGLLEEASRIYQSGIRTKAVMTPIGYKELFPYFEQKKSLEECFELMKKNSRHYAKRQMTWFRNSMNVNWFTVDFSHFENTVEEVLHFILEN